ncbi:MAG: GntR family transcriptional regulator [Anaerolineae bacterium]
MDLDDLPKARSLRDQVESSVSRLIKQLRPGDQLPPEPELARQLGVSRPTLREVLRTFAERGLLVRRQGVGTFVASRIPVLEAGLEILESLERMAERLGLATEMLYLSVSERAATAAELRGLQRDESTPVLVVDRVIAVEGQPVADLRDVVPLTYLTRADICAPEAAAPFRGSVLDVLLARGSPVLTVSKTRILAESANPERADRLSIDPGSPLLKLVAQLFSYDERVVDYSISAFVPGHFEFHVIRQVRG